MSQNNNYPFTWENQEEGTVITLVEQIVSGNTNDITNNDLENALNSIGLSSDDSGLVYTLMVNGKEAGTINIPQDQFLKTVNYNQEEKKLVFLFNTENGESTVEISVADLVDVYTAGNGIEVTDEKKINVIISPNSQKYIEVDSDGIKIVGIDEALALKADKSELEGLASEQWVEEKKYLQEVPETWATDEEVSKAIENKADVEMLSVFAKSVDVEAKYQLKGDYALKSEIPTKSSQLENDVPYLTEHQDVSIFSTKEELKSESDRAVAKENELQVNINNKVSEVKLEKGNSDLQYNLLVDGNVAGTINIPEDQFLKSASYDNENNNIIFIFKTENGENTVNVNISDLVDTYTAGNGLKLEINRFDIVIDSLSEIYLSVSENGIKLSGIDSALASKEDKGVAYSKSESDAKYLTEHQDISHLATNVMFEELMDYIKSLEQRIIVLENRIYSSSDLINLIGNLSEGETTLEIYNDVIVSGEDPIIIPENAVLNLKLNGKTISYQETDILFRVNGTLNISGGNVIGDGYVASANAGGTINVTDGEYKTNITCLQCNGGTVNISGGHYDSYTEQYGRVYTLNHIDSKKNEGLISVTGGTFVGYNPAESHSEYPVMNFVAEGYESVPLIIDGAECYTVVKKTEVSSKEEVIEAIANVGSGEVLALNVNKDITLDKTTPLEIATGATVAINLNGHKFVNAVEGQASIVNNGELVINDGDFVNENVNTQGSDVVDNYGILTINGGTIGSLNNRGAAVRNFGTCTINGGTFSSIEKGTDSNNGYAYVFINQAEDAVLTINDAYVDGNVHGMFACNAGVINVNGGYYKMGENGLHTYYIAYAASGATININGGEYYWTKGITNVSSYAENGGTINIAEGVVINETR